MPSAIAADSRARPPARHRRGPGRAEASSGLAFDSLTDTEPPAGATTGLTPLATRALAPALP